MQVDIKKLEDSIGIKFKDYDLFTAALTHKSYTAEYGGEKWNERLEFLGDSILSAIVVGHLYKKFPELAEGELSRIKSQLVSRKVLAQWAKELDIGKYVFISSGEESSGGRLRESMLANTLEALLGAIYLEKGFSTIKDFVVSRFCQKIDTLVDTDYKSRFQEIVQGKYRVLPVYKVIKETGPEHSKIFEIEVRVKKQVLGRGFGRNKKESQQEAAKSALRKLRLL